MRRCCSPRANQPEPLIAENVRERVVQALERDGKVVRLEVSISTEGRESGEVQTGWLDLARRWGRVEEGESSVRVVAADAMVEIRACSNATTLTDLIPPDWYEGGVGPSAVCDRNELNSREAIVTLPPLLRELE